MPDMARSASASRRPHHHPANVGKLSKLIERGLVGPDGPPSLTRSGQLSGQRTEGIAAGGQQTDVHIGISGNFRFTARPPGSLINTWEEPDQRATSTLPKS